MMPIAYRCDTSVPKSRVEDNRRGATTLRFCALQEIFRRRLLERRIAAAME
jgi:hypothetical protein